MLFEQLVRHLSPRVILRKKGQNIHVYEVYVCVCLYTYVCVYVLMV